MMELSDLNEAEAIFPHCWKLMGDKAWKNLADILCRDPDFTELSSELERISTSDLPLPGYIPDLARLEWSLHQTSTFNDKVPTHARKIIINPSLLVLELEWRNLASLFQTTESEPANKPEPGAEIILISKNPQTQTVDMKVGGQEDLLVLKIVMEDIAAEDIAAAGNLPIGAVDQAINRAIDSGILIAPQSSIQRDKTLFPADFPGNVEDFRRVDVFTLQWHITQHCDLHCKHCYDRSNRAALSLQQAIAVLDDFRAFCKNHNVRGQISFSGGNPFLYPNFVELYQEAANRGFGLAILGNPAPKEKIQQLVDIQMPSFYQVSLEGLPEHNDSIRGKDHFEKIIAFLQILRELDVYSMVMLTLTRANTNEVLPLAEKLNGLTDSFTFNRLAMVGEGAALQSADPAEFKQLLEDYLAASETNPVISIKDNFLNISRWQQGMDLFGGCAGFGCSAAFSFIAILPDGEVHACRKFPSPVGNILEQSLDEVFDSEASVRYRAGTSACGKCQIRPVCGGCLAVSHGFGLDVFNERDPYCFLP